MKYEVTSVELWIMLLSTVRYSLGRRTYMTSLAPDLVMKYEAALSLDQLYQIEKEIVRAILERRPLAPLPRLPDEGAWLRAAIGIGQLRRRRGAEGRGDNAVS